MEAQEILDTIRKWLYIERFIKSSMFSVVMAYTFTTTETIPVTHVHLAKNNGSNGLEAFVSSAGVELSISEHTGRNRLGVLSAGNFERLQHYNYRDISEEQLTKEVVAAFQHANIHPQVRKESVFSEYPGASGDYYHLTFDQNAKLEETAKLLEQLHDKYPQAY